MKPSSSPLQDAEQWCAVESTDPTIREAYIFDAIVADGIMALKEHWDIYGDKEATDAKR